MPKAIWIPFQWQEAQLGGHNFPHAALFVPGTLPGLGNLRGWFQFDLGAPTSVLYGAALLPEQRHLITQLEPVGTAIFNGQKHPLVNTACHVGPWHLERLVYLEEFGDRGETIQGHPILGTIGSDSVREYILALDYPHQRLARLTTLPPAWEQERAWAPLQVSDHGHILLQVEVDGAPRWVIFDTGSSLFHLLTDAQQWNQLTTGQVTETFPISAWGVERRVQGGPARVTFSMAGTPLTIPRIHKLANESEAERQFLAAHNLVGIAGNAPFVQYMLLLDLPHQRAAMRVASDGSP